MFFRNRDYKVKFFVVCSYISSKKECKLNVGFNLNGNILNNVKDLKSDMIKRFML